jgi:hypothetical protein
MARTLAIRGGVLLLLLGALGLFVAGAAGRPLVTTTAVIQVIGQGKVTGGGGQIDCGEGAKSCYASYIAETSVTITASALPGWTFGGWDNSDDCTGTSPTCTIPLNGNAREEFAHFVPANPVGTSILDVDPQPATGEVFGGDIDCGSDGDDCEWDDITTGSTVTLVEDPDTGYSLGGWGGACSGTAASCTLVLSGDRTVSANFIQSATTYTLTVSVTGEGTVTGGGIACTVAGGSGCTATEASGTAVTLTATSGSGGTFTGWGGSCAGDAVTCVVSMTSNQNVTASFSGGTNSSFPLSVSVDGPGKVSGSGISCGNGDTACGANLPAGSNVTLSATPATGASFGGWGGACSGTTMTCTVGIDAAKAVSATFTSGTPSGIALTLQVSGNGTVSGPGGSCTASGATKTCSQSYAQGSRVTLAATPGARASFRGWSGACSGARSSCTLTMDAAKSVGAAFTGASKPPPGSAGLRSLGQPRVKTGPDGFAVTLRMSSSRQGIARLRAIRAGRSVEAFSFSVTPGSATVGPFLIKTSGYYTFRVTLGTEVLRWKACLGRCGESAPGPRFTVTRLPPTFVDAGAAWSITLHVRASLAAALDLAVYRGKTLALASHSARQAGPVNLGPYLVSPGSYSVRLTASDGFGRVRSLTWVAFLP